jgi:amino acid adenylation domain-containing protein
MNHYPGDEIEDCYPLSPIQQGMLIQNLYIPGPVAIQIQGIGEINQELDVPCLKRAWETVIQRHPILRSSFHLSGLPEPVQKIHRRVDLNFVERDLRGMPGAEQRLAIEEFLREDWQRGFQLEVPEHLRFMLFRLDETAWRFGRTIHHLLTDMRSSTLMFLEALDTYDALHQGQDVRREMPPSYRQYIDCVKGQDFSGAEGYWQDRLKGFTTPNPFNVDRRLGGSYDSLPLAYPGKQQKRLSKELTRSLIALAKEQNLGLSTLVHGAWAILLSRYSAQEDVVFGVTRACRRSAVEKVDEIVGPLVNTLPLRVQVSSHQTVKAWLQELRLRWLELKDVEHSSLLKIQGWSEVLPGLPLFESILNYDHRSFDNLLQSRPTGLRLENYQYKQAIGYPLVVGAFGDEELLLMVDYDRRRFDDATIGRLLGHLEVLLNSLATRPGESPASLPMLSDAEMKQVLAKWSRGKGQQVVKAPRPTDCGWPEQASLVSLFEAVVERSPAAVAVTCEGEILTYGELNRRANRLASYLQALGVRPEMLVGICLERSLDLIVAILGILKAGGAYVPLDPELPRERLTFIMKDTEAVVLLTQAAFLDKLSDLPLQVVCLDRDRPAIANCPGENLANTPQPGDLAYVIYTSGSTGAPKGVLISHHNVVRLFRSTQGWFDFSADDVWTLFHSAAFDFSVWEIWGALLYGGRLVVVPYWTSRLPDVFVELLRQERVTVLNQTPSAFMQLLRIPSFLDPASFPALRLVIFGGEALNVPALRPWFERYGDEKPCLVNMFGITETTVHVTYRPLTSQDLLDPASVIGVPLPDLQLYLLDAYMQPVPVGVPGEIYVSGAGVSRGYLNRPELSAGRFVPDPFSPGGRLYRSGDLARYRENGDLEFLGRADRQVKLRGFRVELGEVESALVSYPGVHQAVVLTREAADDPTGRQLVAYLVQDASREVTEPRLQSYLRAKLPEYMIPAQLVFLSTIPLTPNGKVDSRALLAMDTASHGNGMREAPQTVIEQALALLWAEVLGTERIGVQDDFFDLGGQSLLAVKLAARIRDLFQVDLPMRLLFDAPTVAQIAQMMQQASGDASRLEKRAEWILKLSKLSESEAQEWLANWPGTGEKRHGSAA